MEPPGRHGCLKLRSASLPGGDRSAAYVDARGASPTLHARALRTPADCMPRNEGLEIEVPLQPRGRGIVRDAAAEIPDLPYLRLTGRIPPPRDRRNLWILLALVLVGHAFLGWVVYQYLHRPPYHGDHGAIAVSIIEPTAAPSPPPELAPPPLEAQPAPPPRRLHYVPPAKGAISATLESAKGKPLELYNSNGQIRLNTSEKSAPAPAFSAPEIKGSQIYSGKSPVPYKPTPFAKGFEPTNQSLGAKTIGRAFDKAVEKTTVQKTIHLPGGIKVHCAVAPLLLMAAGCSGDAPQPPPTNDDDVRLSMPPAETLTGKKVTVPPSASSAHAPASSGAN